LDLTAVGIEENFDKMTFSNLWRHDRFTRYELPGWGFN